MDVRILYPIQIKINAKDNKLCLLSCRYYRRDNPVSSSCGLFSAILHPQDDRAHKRCEDCLNSETTDKKMWSHRWEH
jgi:hypothetical protein